MVETEHDLQLKLRLQSAKEEQLTFLLMHGDQRAFTLMNHLSSPAFDEIILEQVKTQGLSYGDAVLAAISSLGVSPLSSQTTAVSSSNQERLPENEANLPYLAVLKQAGISLETFDEAVRENMDEFGMSREEAIEDALEQFKLAGKPL